MNIDLNYWYLYLFSYQFGLIALVAIILSLCWGLWWLFPKNQADRLGLILGDAKARADVEDNFRKTIGQLFGGIAVLIGALFAYIQFSQQQRDAYNQFSQQQQVSHDLLISNQVSKGFEQLGSDKTVVKLGGIYALEGVMNTSDQYHLPVLEALCAFVRDNIGAKTPDPRNDESITTDIQAVLTVIGRRADGAGQVDLAGAKIPSADLTSADLSHADLSNADLSNADLSGARLNNAHLDSADLSHTDLNGAHLNDAHLNGANLVKAENLNNANLDSAHLSNADLNDANLSHADLSGARLNGAHLNGANLTYANLIGAHLNNANLNGAHLDGANLSSANLSGANLSSVVGLSQTQLSTACGVNAILPFGLTLDPCR